MVLILETIAKREVNISMNKEIVSSFDPISTFDSTTSENRPNFFHQQAAISRQAQQERRLIVDSVRNADCRDFPFDAVLSLEDAVKKDLSALQASKMRGTGGRRVSSSKSKSVSCLNETGHKAGLQRSQNKPSSKMTKKNRPPLLKCPTWPNSQYSDGGSDNSADSYPPGASESSSVSKIDSPSFYSVSAIDFSAISHLSEEHDKQIAQENAEKSSIKHAYISNSTREKLYGKATQKTSTANGRTGRDMQKLPPFDIYEDNGTVFTLTSVPFDGQMLQACSPSSEKSPENEASVSLIKNKKAKVSKKSAKAELSSIEKVIRKRYSSSPSITVSSVPIAALQNEDNSAVVIESHSIPISTESIANNETEEGSKKQTTIPAEKQPLPPEGFKISRYPLKKTPSLETKTTPPSESDRQKTEAGLYRLIGELRKQLQRAEDKITEAENQVREWKEIAQRTKQAVEVIKVQIEVNKQQAQQEQRAPAVPLSDPPQTTFNRVEVRRWSDEKATNDDKDKKLSNEVIQRFLMGKNYVPDNTSGRKRALPQECHVVKRQCTIDVEKPSNLAEQKNKSLLAWLANSEPENDVDYMSFLEVSDKKSVKIPRSNNDISKLNAPEIDSCIVSTSSQPIVSHRYVAHNETRNIEIVQQEKPRDDYFVVELHPKIPSKTPLHPQNSFDRFLETFTPIEMNYPSNSPSLGSDGEKTPVSLPLQSPDIPSPILGQSVSDSEFPFGADQLGDADISRALDDVDFLNQLDDILDI